MAGEHLLTGIGEPLMTGTGEHGIGEHLLTGIGEHLMTGITTPFDRHTCRGAPHWQRRTPFDRHTCRGAPHWQRGTPKYHTSDINLCLGHADYE